LGSPHFGGGSFENVHLFRYKTVEAITLEDLMFQTLVNQIKNISLSLECGRYGRGKGFDVEQLKGAFESALRDYINARDGVVNLENLSFFIDVLRDFKLIGSGEIGLKECKELYETMNVGDQHRVLRELNKRFPLGLRGDVSGDRNSANT
jgi:hypothetical protein